MDRQNKDLNGGGIEEHSRSEGKRANNEQGSSSRGIRMEEEV